MAPKENWSNKEDVLAAIKEVGPHVFLYTYEELRGDREFEKECLSGGQGNSECISI